MHFRNISMFVLFAVLIIFALTEQTSAQNKTCSLRVMTYRVDTEAPVFGSVVTASQPGAKEVYRSEPKDGVPFFARLEEGEYQLTAQFEGYQKSLDSFALKCSSAENGVVRTAIPLREVETDESVSMADVVQKPANEGNVSTGRFTGVDRVKEGIEVDRVGDKTGTASVGISEQVRGIKAYSGGVLNSKALTLVKPVYPAAAREVRAGGAVIIDILVDESGNVVAAAAVSGHPLLRAASVKAAMESKFPPAFRQGEPVKIRGVIVYNFIP